MNSNLINPRILEEEIARKKQQFYENLELLRQTTLDKVSTKPNISFSNSIINIHFERLVVFAIISFLLSFIFKFVIVRVI